MLNNGDEWLLSRVCFVVGESNVKLTHGISIERQLLSVQQRLEVRDEIVIIIAVCTRPQHVFVFLFFLHRFSLSCIHYWKLYSLSLCLIQIPLECRADYNYVYSDDLSLVSLSFFRFMYISGQWDISGGS